MESKRGSRGWSPLARRCWQTAEGFAQMAGGGGRGNANSKQALASGAGGQRGCVCQTSGLAMGRPSPVCHNAGSEPAGHVVARGGVSRSGVPKWFCRPSSAPSLHDPGSPALKNPSAFHFFPSPHPCYVPPPPYMAPAAVATQHSPHGAVLAGVTQLLPDKGGRAGEGSVSTGWAAPSAAAPSICGCRGSAPRCHPSVVSGRLFPAGTAPCVNQLPGVHRPFASLAPARVCHRAQDWD